MTNTVIVCCKLPNGLILDVDGKRHKVNGWHDEVIVGTGYGKTDDVPAELWEKWLETYKESPVVKNGLIFAESKDREAKAHAKDKAEAKSGLEQIDPLKKTDKAGSVGALDV